MVEMTLTVSPDGRRVAWFSGTGELMTSKVDGSDERTLGPESSQALCARPIWTPDSRQVIFGGSDAAQIINVDGSGRTSLKTPYPCDHVSLLDGKRLAWITNESVEGVASYLVIGAMTSTQTQRFPLRRPVINVVTVSPDARRAIVTLVPPNMGESDPLTDRQMRYSTYPERKSDGTLVDVASGAVLPAPVPGDILEAIYEVDGTLLLRTVIDGAYGLSLVAPDGRVVAKTAELAELFPDSVVAYVP